MSLARQRTGFSKAPPFEQNGASVWTGHWLISLTIYIAQMYFVI